MRDLEVARDMPPWENDLLDTYACPMMARMPPQVPENNPEERIE